MTEKAIALDWPPAGQTGRGGRQARRQAVQIIVETVVLAVQPEQIILFGSRAKGTAREGSDYDLLVVIQDAENEREVSRRIYRALLDQKVAAAVDVVVVNRATLEQRKESPFFIYRQALREGRVAYERGGV